MTNFWLIYIQKDQSDQERLYFTIDYQRLVRIVTEKFGIRGTTITIFPLRLICYYCFVDCTHLDWRQFGRHMGAHRHPDCFNHDSTYWQDQLQAYLANRDPSPEWLALHRKQFLIRQHTRRLAQERAYSAKRRYVSFELK